MGFGCGTFLVVFVWLRRFHVARVLASLLFLVEMGVNSLVWVVGSRSARLFDVAD